MNKSEFLKALEGQLEVPMGSLKEDQSLSDVDAWDSLAAVLFIALADEEVGVVVSGDQIAKAKTVGDLLSLVGHKLTA